MRQPQAAHQLSALADSALTVVCAMQIPPPPLPQMTKFQFSYQGPGWTYALCRSGLEVTCNNCELPGVEIGRFNWTDQKKCDHCRDWLESGWFCSSCKTVWCDRYCFFNASEGCKEHTLINPCWPDHCALCQGSCVPGMLPRPRPG